MMKMFLCVLLAVSALSPSVQVRGRKYTTVIKDADLVFQSYILTRSPRAVKKKKKKKALSLFSDQFSLSAGSMKPAGHVGLGPRNKVIRCGGLVFNSIKVFRTAHDTKAKIFRELIMFEAFHQVTLMQEMLVTVELLTANAAFHWKTMSRFSITHGDLFQNVQILFSDISSDYK